MTATLPRWLCEKATLEQLMAAALPRLLCEKAVFRFAAKLFQICCSACASCFYFLQTQLPAEVAQRPRGAHRAKHLTRSVIQHL